MKETKKSIYDEICRVLTEWESQEAVDDDLYNTLVKVVNNWEDVITAKEEEFEERVVQYSMDIFIRNEEENKIDLEELIASALGEKGLYVCGVEFNDDLTEIYEQNGWMEN